MNQLIPETTLELILLPPLAREDFAALIAAEDLEPLAREARVAIDLDQAVQSRLGRRWCSGST